MVKSNTNSNSKRNFKSSNNSKRKKIKQKAPGQIRVGVALLILGAIVAGIGTMMNREALSIYGFIIVLCGFILYFGTVIYMKYQKKNSR